MTSAGVQVVRNARARRLRLRVDAASGCVRLTLPPRASLKRALAWVEEQRGWIERQQAAMPAARPFVPGAVLPIGGVDTIVDWSAERPRIVSLNGHDGLLVCGGPRDGVARRIESWLKRHALATLSRETAEYAARGAGVTVARVAIGDPKGRWGSCAANGVIRYSWRLILAPVFVRRATVAHEVAHRVHMDHSPAFHAQVRALLGEDPAVSRAWLRRHGAALHWFGRDS
ncbi:M48 family metallopeptidase [uncultured Sphingomonas sp.]|uniref:M48 family metallopeptidase n=1 Tax=uncultured Sphingomonas sp. TaxID=158754 RepID=UPI0035CA6A74